jgi:hypothetical protein
MTSSNVTKVEVISPKVDTPAERDDAAHDAGKGRRVWFLLENLRLEIEKSKLGHLAGSRLYVVLYWCMQVPIIFLAAFTAYAEGTESTDGTTHHVLLLTCASTFLVSLNALFNFGGKSKEFEKAYERFLALELVFDLHVWNAATIHQDNSTKLEAIVYSMNEDKNDGSSSFEVRYKEAINIAPPVPICLRGWAERNALKARQKGKILKCAAIAPEG